MIKSPQDLDNMAESGRILAEIIEKISAKVAPGVTPNDLDKLTNELVAFYKVKPAFLGYNNFPATVCISINDEIVHGVPTDRLLEQGDLISIDMGVVYNGWYSDSAVTLPVLGNMKYETWSKEHPDAAKLLAVTEEALYAGIKRAIAGNHLGDISHAVQSVIERNKLGIVRDLVGHGIGRELHEQPHVPNFGAAGSGPILRAGMVLAIEPMVTIGSPKLVVAADGFTYKTKDHSLSAHFEHTVAITEDGPKVLTERRKFS